MFRAKLYTALGAFALCSALSTLHTSTGFASSIVNYGNLTVPASAIMFLDVKESSGTDSVPLYGPPTPFSVGLNFFPDQFVASSAGGGADITDGQLNFTVMGSVSPSGGIGIGSINLSEGGLYSLLGVGTGATQVFAGALISAQVIEIDGVAVAPIVLGGGPASLNATLPLSPGGLQTWSLSISVPIASQLTTLGYNYTIGATKVKVVVDNSLVAISEPLTTANILKNRVSIGITPDLRGSVPEPASMSLALGLVGGLAAARRRGGAC